MQPTSSLWVIHKEKFQKQSFEATHTAVCLLISSSPRKQVLTPPGSSSAFHPVSHWRQADKLRSSSKVLLSIKQQFPVRLENSPHQTCFNSIILLFKFLCVGLLPLLDCFLQLLLLAPPTAKSLFPLLNLLPERPTTAKQPHQLNFTPNFQISI